MGNSKKQLHDHRRWIDERVVWESLVESAVFLSCIGFIYPQIMSNMEMALPCCLTVVTAGYFKIPYLKKHMAYSYQGAGKIL
jgi:hypothetical protein